MQPEVIIRLRYPDPRPGWQAELTEAVRRATAEIGRLDSNAERRAVLVLEDQPGGQTPLHVRLSLQEALRSLVQSNTLENPSLGLCLVFADSYAARDLERTLDYITGPTGQFVHGATIDLGTAQ